MKQIIIKGILLILAFCTLLSCGNKLEEKGFAVPSAKSTDNNKVDGIAGDSITFATRPSNVLLTGIPRFRLTTIYKVNYNDDSVSFIGSNDFHFNYEETGETNGNRWHNNLMPGWEVVYGYNLVNISHYDTETKTQKNFFERPVLIKNVYYPSFSKDTLNYKPITRNYYMVSVYDEDTNKDGRISARDLRRFYHVDVDASAKRPLVPVNYSVFKSEYDPANDFLYVFAQLDKNENGKIDEGEATHIFWIDLKDPQKTGRQY